MSGTRPTIPQRSVHACARRSAASDVVITIGGVSAGDFDPVKEALGGIAGAELWRVAMKPGRPQAFGADGRAAVLRPARQPGIRRVRVRDARAPGAPPPARGSRRPTDRAFVCASRDRSNRAAGAPTSCAACWLWRDGAWWAEPAGAQISGHLTPQSRADALIVVAEPVEALAAGDVRAGAALALARLLPMATGRRHDSGARSATLYWSAPYEIGVSGGDMNEAEERPDETAGAVGRGVLVIVVVGIALGLGYNQLLLASGPKHGLAWVKQETKLASLEDLPAATADTAMSTLAPPVTTTTEPAPATAATTAPTAHAPTTPPAHAATSTPPPAHATSAPASHATTGPTAKSTPPAQQSPPPATSAPATSSAPAYRACRAARDS
jgi:hypothetical protein